ncbi:glycerol-1-phosphate dehydrogenase [Archaeoglobales archaeon]|nr:MAG: glycerol-1-phosphate dehydrogenase [Archaeoglobales archaeon]
MPQRRFRISYLKNIELPLIVEVGEGPRKKIGDVLDYLNLLNVVLLSGRRSYEVVGEKIESRVSESIVAKFFVEKPSVGEVRKLSVRLSYEDVDGIVGVGGGKVLDVGKVLATELNVAFVSIPTVASHDGIASPVASFKEGGKPVSISTNPPAAVLADLVILRHSPIRLLRAGYGDLISNVTAVKDWKLARDVVGEEYNEVAASMAEMPANLMLSSADMLDLKVIKHLEMLVRGLILSGVAISLAGSSRPASGAEHKFSHALDYLGYGEGLHGEQVAIGTIIMEYLHEKRYGVGNWELLKMSLEKIRAPTTAKEIGLTKEQIVEALIYAKKIRRKRYTILDEVEDKEEFKIALEKTKVA